MIRSPRRRAGPAALAALLLVAGCGEISGPYAHNSLARLSNPLVVLPSGAGIGITPVDGLPPPWNRLVALEAAETLRLHGIPAETGGDASLGHRLTWSATPLDGDEAHRRFRLTWTLEGDTDSANGLDIAVDAESWDQAAPEAAATFARPVVVRLIALFGGSETPQDPARRLRPLMPPPPATEPPSPEEARREAARATEAAAIVALTPRITEAPGDGVRALTEALTNLIKQAGVRVTDDPATATFGLVGSVTTEPAANGQDKVSLVWEITQPSSGRVLGTVRQENVVPRGYLEKPWGPLADVIAAAVLEGVGDILAGETPAP